MNQNTAQSNYLKLQCPECGAPIEVTEHNHATCSFCNQTFLLDEAEGLIVNVNVDYGNSIQSKKTIIIALIALGVVLANALFLVLVIFLINSDAIHSNYFSSDYDSGVTGANVCKKLCTDIFDKPYKEITDDELASIRYIKYNNERLSGTDVWMHVIEYSFTDYQDCESEEEFQSTVKTWTCQEHTSNDPFDQTPDFTMLTGLTRIAIDEYMNLYSKNCFSKAADIRYVTSHSQAIGTDTIRAIVNPENVEVLEYKITRNIEGIKDFPNLKTLQIDIWFGSEFDISEIEYCQNLENLTITKLSADLLGIEKIEELKKLKSLSLQNLYLHECDFISNLTNLEQLTIEIDDEKPGTEVLRNLNKLDTLYLSGRGCVPAKDILHLENITTLKLSINTLEAFHALAKLTDLTTLDVCVEVPCENREAWSRQSILDMSSLANLPNLEYLHIQPEPESISDDLYIYGLEPLLNNPQLKGIYINEQKQPVLSSSYETSTLCINKDSLTTNDSLQRLQFVACTFKDARTENPLSLDFISCYPNLEYFVADECDLDDISFITTLANLKYCSLAHNNLQDFTPLNQCKFLEVVALYGNPNDTPELSDEIVILTQESYDVNLTDYLMGVEREVGYIKLQESDEDE